MDGFAPGEAASFMLLEQASQNKTNTKAVIVDWAEASEEGHRYSQEAYLGEALATATTSALKKIPKASVGSLYANLNGESFFAKEWGIAQLRNGSWFSEEIEVNHPADCFGDLGAAMGPVQIALIVGQKSASQMHLLCLSSELDTRSAIVLNTSSTRLS
jgi:3-oxoacyl-[acyl-carrier-protein] synthase-1